MPLVLASFYDGKAHAFDAATGKKLWQGTSLDSGHRSPEDLLVIDALAWSAELDPNFSRADREYKFIGLDLKTGEVGRELAIPMKINMHHRCHRAKGTQTYYITSRMGIEYNNVKTGESVHDYWTRGACNYGIMPANGFTYAPQTPCACMTLMKPDGLNALCPSSAVPTEASHPLDKGPAFEKHRKSRLSIPAGTWSTYRGGPSRSGATGSLVPERPAIKWTAKVGEDLTPPVTALGKVFVASKDERKVMALDAESGKILWTFKAGGLVDTPPTILAANDGDANGEGLALFACADGFLYSLDAQSGELAWRLRLAPSPLQMIDDDKLESVWPAHGSVLVRTDSGEEDPVIWAVAGRNRMFDGGLYLLRVNAGTGEVLTSRNPGPLTEKEHDLLTRHGRAIDSFFTTRPQILCEVEGQIFMGTQAFHPDGSPFTFEETGWSSPNFDEKTVELFAKRIPEHGKLKPHLIANTGFTDGEAWQRNYWTFGTKIVASWSYYNSGRYQPSARLLAVDDEHVFGYGTSADDFKIKHISPANNYRMFRAKRNPDIKIHAEKLNRYNGRNIDAEVLVDWETQIPVNVTALLKADNRIVVAGPPEIVPENKLPTDYIPNTEDLPESLRIAQEAWEGKHGGKLLAISAGDGKTTTELDLPSRPVFDGMAAGDKCLFISLSNGSLVCLSESN